MMRKSATAVAFAAGYLLGARAGRERYDAIVAKAQGLWQDPRVQQKVGQAQEVAKQKASHAQDAAMDMAKDKLPGERGSGPSGSTPTTGAGSGAAP